MAEPNIFTVGGTVQANERGLYISRRADGELLALCRAATFAYVLTPRQMGKSSLMIRTAEQLMEEGVQSVIVDLTQIGTQVTVEQWYKGLLTLMADQLMLNTQVEFWWQAHSHLGVTQRLTRFFEKVVLAEVQDPIVVFVDEIDTTLSLDFTDDFYAAIRSLYLVRATQPELRRISFVLIGVATPGDLIRDPKRTPFNIGQAVNLTGFQLHEAEPLARGLNDLGDSSILIREILHWTGGQPFLTQKLCNLVQKTGAKINPGEEAAWVECLVREQVIENWESKDEKTHLRTIRDRLLEDDLRVNRILGLYQQVLQEDVVYANNLPAQMKLSLSGLVVNQQEKLKVYNQIYAAIFNLNWVAKEFKNLRPYSESLNAWLQSNCKDESRLLQGNALQDALKWAKDRSLNPIDANFLRDSQARLQKTWIKRFKKLSFLVATLFILLILIFQIYQSQIGYARLVVRAADLERDGENTLQQFNLAPIKALESGIKSGRRLKILQNESKSSNHVITNPVLALQTIVENIHEVNEINTYQKGVNSVNFIEKNQIVTAGEDGTIRLWDQNSGKQKGILLAHSRGVNSVRFGEKKESKSTFVTAGVDGIIKFWSLTSDGSLPETSQYKYEFKGHSSSIRSVRFNPKETLLATIGETDGILKLWTLKGDLRGDPKVDIVWELLAHKNGVESLNFSPNEEYKYIATGGKDGTAKLWDLEGNQLQIFKHIDNGFQGGVNSVTFSREGDKLCQNDEKSISCKYKKGKMIATAGDDGIVKLWDLQGNLLKAMNTHVGKVKASRFSPDNLQLATSSGNDSTSLNESSVRIWSLDTGELLSEFKGHQGSVESIRYNFDGKNLATSGREDGKVVIWAVPKTPIYRKEEQHQKSINSIRFSPDDQRIATAGDDGKIRLWSQDKSANTMDNPTLRLDKIFPSYKDLNLQILKLKSIRFSPNGQQLAVGGSDDTIRILKLNGTPINKIQTGLKTIESINFSHDGKLLGVVGDEQTAELWSIKEKFLSKIDLSKDLKYGGRTQGLRFSLDDKKIAVVGDNGVAVLWDISTGQKQELRGHEGTVYTVGFNPDGKSLATTGDDGTIRQWDFSKYPILAKEVIQTYQGSVRSISFRDDGQLIATAGSGGTVRLWNPEGRQLANFKGHQGIVMSLNFSKNGQWLVSAGDDGRPRIWFIRSLDQLLDQGCEKLKDYLKNSPDKVKICPK
jgi:WD40 repeat protein